MAAAPAPTANPLLTARVLPTLWRLAVPNIVAMVGSAVAAIAETAYVGQLGVASLAGMALVFPLLMLQQMFSGGAMGGGIASLVSRALGAGQVVHLHEVLDRLFLRRRELAHLALERLQPLFGRLQRLAQGPRGLGHRAAGGGRIVGGKLDALGEDLALDVPQEQELRGGLADRW